MVASDIPLKEILISSEVITLHGGAAVDTNLGEERNPNDGENHHFGREEVAGLEHFGREEISRFCRGLTKIFNERLLEKLWKSWKKRLPGFLPILHGENHNRSGRLHAQDQFDLTSERINFPSAIIAEHQHFGRKESLFRP